jgi:hypothetical protein
MALDALAPLAAAAFGDDFGLVVLILVFFGVFKTLANDFIPSPKVAMIVTVIIIFLVVVPYDWFKYLLFAVLFLYSFFEKATPWKWGWR